MRLMRSSMLALGLTAVLAGTALGAKLDQAQTDTPTDFIHSFASGPSIDAGQVLTAGRTGRLVSVRLFAAGDWTGMSVQVRQASGGEPTGPILASEAWTSSTTNGWVRVRFDHPPRMVAGRQYYVGIHSTVGAIQTRIDFDPSAYPAGRLVFRWNEGSWIEVGDLAFETYVAKELDDLDWVGVSQSAWNTPRAGQTIKVRFSLGGEDWGTKVIKGGWPKVRRVNCTTRKPIAGTEWQTRPLGGDLAFNDATDRYALSWKVPAAWGVGAMACRELRVQLIDGTTHSLFFRFRPAA